MVARATMHRARRNVERLVERLPSIGYEFAVTDDRPVFDLHPQTSSSNWII